MPGYGSRGYQGRGQPSGGDIGRGSQPNRPSTSSNRQPGISTSNKVLVLAAITGGCQTHAVYYKLQHNGSGSYADVDGAKGVADGSRTRISSYGVGGTSDNAEMQTTILCYLDSPSKDSSFQYRVGGSVRASGTTWTINRPYDDTDATYTGRGVSTLTLMEVKG